MKLLNDRLREFACNFALAILDKIGGSNISYWLIVAYFQYPSTHEVRG